MPTGPRMRKRAIQLIGNDNGAGLTRDMRLVARILREGGHQVTVTRLNNRARLSHRWQRFSGRARQLLRNLARGRLHARYDLNLMCESVSARYFRQAGASALLPHPEWFDQAWLADLGGIDLVLAKTHHAQRIFSELGRPVIHTGFVSEDQRAPDIARQPTFFHGPGRSNNKGTAQILKLWADHPDWPQLTVVWRSDEARAWPQTPANVRLIREYVGDEALRELQNSSVFHLCPSQTEGYGHSIVESLGIGAVVISTDAEPMNELVTPEHGILVAAHAAGTQALATLYDFDMDAMRAAIERCIHMPEAEQQRLGQAARRWFEDNRRDFPGRLLRALDTLP